MRVDQELERKVLRHLIGDVKKIIDIQQRGVTETFFRYPPARKLYDIALWYSQNYSTPLFSEFDLKEILKQSKSFSDELKTKISVFYEEVKAEPLDTNYDLLVDSFFSYHKNNLAIGALDKATDFLSNKDVENAIASLKSDLVRIDKVFTTSIDYSGLLSEHSSRFLTEYVDRQQNPEKYRGIFVGYGEFDKATGGLRPGTVTLIIGAMKSAKSVLCLNMGHNVAKPDPQKGFKGRRVYYHVNEGGFRLAYERFLSCATGIDYNHIRNATIQPNSPEYTKLATFLNQNRALLDNFYIDPVSPMMSTSTYINNKLKELESVSPSEFVIIDYLGLMTTDNKTVDSGWEKLGAITLELKHVAMERNVPIVLIAHVNREGMKSKKSESYNPEDMGLSIEPLKHVDNIISWKIEDPDALRLSHQGVGVLSIQASRDAQACDTRLDINTNLMKVYENIIKIGK